VIIITTVGTSIFENFFKENTEFDTLKDDYQDRLRNSKDTLVDFKRWEDIKIRRKLEKLEQYVSKWSKEESNASAEITSILEIARQTEEAIQVHLIATDTVLSVLAAELVKSWFAINRPNITVNFVRPEKLDNQAASDYIIYKLRVASNDDFQEGFMNLIEVVSKLIDANLKIEEQIILNITGGYKAIVPILTLIGQVKNVPLKYIYEESDTNEKSSLVEIDKLPFSFDWELGELYLDDLFKDGLKQINKKPETLHFLRNRLKLINTHNYKLTPLGKLFTTSLKNLLTSKKSTLGYLVELKIFEYFVKNKKKVIRGKSIWWSKKDRSKFFDEAQYQRDDKLEQKIDIDIFIEQEAGEIWREVKACSNTGLNKARKQLVTMLDFISQTSYDKVKEIGLILYKLETTDLSFYEKQLTGIVRLFEGQPIKFTLNLINIPINKKGIFNTKCFFEQEITLYSYN